MARDSSTILVAASSFDEIREALLQVTEDTKGSVFEILVQKYLQLSTTYDFANVWSTHREVPKAVLQRLNLFGRDVTGIDLVAETRDGKFWAIQCKYHTDEKWSLTRTEATGLIAGMNRARDEFELGLICTTANGRSRNLEGEPKLEYLMGDVWRGLGSEFFNRLRAHLKGAEPKPPVRKKPRPHQQEALNALAAHFSNHGRGKVVMPCGTGKSLIGYWASERLGARKVLLALPNLSLVRQLLKDWTEQSIAQGRRPRWVVVCSDDSVAARDLGVKVGTDPREVAAWLKSNERSDLLIAITTYQSGKILAAAAKQAKLKFDLGIFDEAHRTAGREAGLFAHLLSDENVEVHHRVFMTATPRIFKGTHREDVISMNDPARYGGEAFRMSFLAAMDRGIIPNLTILAVTVSTKEVDGLLRDKRFVRFQQNEVDEVIRAEDVVSALALRKAMRKYGIRRTLGFYSSRKRCLRAAELHRVVDALLPEHGKLEVFHVNGEMTAAERDSEMRDFEQSSGALLTNVRVFVEGVDCPSLDAVIFADPRQSVIDIVQGVGRALRPFEGKEAGFAIIPTVINEDGTPSDAAYTQVVRTACAIGSENEVILDYFAAIAHGKPWTGRRVFEVLGDVDVGVVIDPEKLNQAVAVAAYERTVEWRPFIEARPFVRALGLKSESEWDGYCAGTLRGKGRKPYDIPSSPRHVYREDGWYSMGDWLGSGVVATYRKKYRPFVEARRYVRKLKLKGTSDWQAYCAGELPDKRKPDDIPSNPQQVYKNDGWRSMGDWLGTGVIAHRFRKYLPFAAARAFVHKLGLKRNGDWRAYCRGDLRDKGSKPDDIPAKPELVYANEGWQGMGDWLGNGRFRRYRSFVDARAYAQSLGLASMKAWREHALSGKKPRDIPTAPGNVYRNDGWVDSGDWLGTNYVANYNRKYRSFKDARTFAQGLKLSGKEQWTRFAKSKRKPADIPASPNTVYKEKGWIGFADWLGAGQNKLHWRSFDAARAFVHRLGLKSYDDWIAYARSSRKPRDIPASPNVIYKHRGWVSFGDWLGTGRRGRGSGWRSFPDARRFAQSLGLKDQSDWSAFAKSGKRPADIPSSPDRIYAGAGWIGYGDWLGNGRVRRETGWRSFSPARAFVRRLRLASNKQWRHYASSGDKPNDIPSNPDATYRGRGWISWPDWLRSAPRRPASLSQVRGDERRRGLPQRLIALA